jgi:hypothetical protein
MGIQAIIFAVLTVAWIFGTKKAGKTEPETEEENQENG